jgi:AraC-like DNA-binding protein
MTIEVSARIGAMIVQVAAASGADTAELQRVTGFDPAIAKDPDARIVLEVENALWEHAARLTGDPYFGLHASAHMRAGMFDVIDYVLRTAPTLRDALERLARYNRLVHSAAVFELIELPDRLRIEHGFAVPGHAPSRHASEFTLSALIVMGSQISGTRVQASAVELPSPAPGDVTIYVDVFGVAPQFAAPRGAVELSREVLARPSPAADPMLSEVILRQANALLASLPDPHDSFANRIRRIVSAQLAHGSVTLADVARELHMSERSVQRRLADDEQTFDAIVEELRRELALRYLRDKALAIGEVAYLLGYSEPSAFHRAFKRWTGSTPAEARAAM